MSDRYYITTTLPYVNADPHLGHALEFIQADVLARTHRILGDDVVFNIGTDEHGQKIYEKALLAVKNPQDYVNEYAERFKNAAKLLSISYTNFVRTTDPGHKEAAQEFWKKCEANGDIYKKFYKVKYCVGCELEKTDSELEGGKCPIHPNLEVQTIEEENYFFRFSNYTDKLSKFYDTHPSFVIPDTRFKEIKAFIERGLEDFSISRLKNKMPWGVEVPGDPDHVMYVWFDALVNYISTLGWPKDISGFNNYWPGIQVAGKDNLRQQSAMWQAMLVSAGLPESKQIFIHGFVLAEGGQKMSKSLGNVIDPLELVREYNADSLRYYLLREISSYEDGVITKELFKEAYNANLANGVGNLVSRVMKMAIDYEVRADISNKSGLPKEIKEALDQYDFKSAMDFVWQKITSLDKRIQETEPFKLIKTEPQKAKEILRELLSGVYEVGLWLAPFLPETSKKICEAVETNTRPETLFPRKD